jgi:signal peptidase II
MGRDRCFRKRDKLIEKENVFRVMRKYHFLIALFVIALDRVTKWAIAHHLALHDSITVIPGFFRIIHAENPGAAFGIFADSPSEWKVCLLILFSVIALLIVSALLWKNSHSLTSTGIGLSLILGGAIGNLWDRLVSRHVVDFLLFYIGPHQWPAFNVADSAIVVGAGLLVFEIVFTKSPSQQSA